jgi:pimeloyl-ACP methyl ester carboxylesterase
MEYLHVNNAVIEYQVQGKGEPVLLIPLSLVGDGLGRPLLAQPELAARYQIIQYHRRGYLGSTLGSEPLTGACQAVDASSLLQHLGVKKAHVVGHSFGAQIALQLAVDAPELVHSLALLEPPLRMVPSAKASFERNVFPMMNAYRAGEKRKAVELFSDAVFGPDWQTIVEITVPGGFEQAVQDVDTFIQEQGDFQDWQFSLQDAAAITQPVLSVLGRASFNPYMQEVRLQLHSWFPQIEDCDVLTTHLLQMQDPKGVANCLAGFFSRHPISPSLLRE